MPKLFLLICLVCLLCACTKDVHQLDNNVEIPLDAYLKKAIIQYANNDKLVFKNLQDNSLDTIVVKYDISGYWSHPFSMQGNKIEFISRISNTIMVQADAQVNADKQSRYQLQVNDSIYYKSNFNVWKKDVINTYNNDSTIQFHEKYITSTDTVADCIIVYDRNKMRRAVFAPSKGLIYF